MAVPDLEIALIHAPVVNRMGACIGSAVTNLDLHDLARVCCTYGVRRYWLVTPFAEQRRLIREIREHWLSGHGGKTNPDRRQAMERVRVSASVEAMLMHMSGPVSRLLVATSARPYPEKHITFRELRSRVETGERILILLGTAWGLAPEVLAQADRVLEPVQGAGSYNHLAVRSAGAIVLDRLLAPAWWAG